CMQALESPPFTF
nr:immunoglobulin light chain junction region [Macaca mulatta]